ncbi:MAG: hypothetical protein J4431_01240 [Candidatus Aenigmarchaeota archaeon]|nr:hypothetical protein [Candidatus Aenigmarchaeota archaeon]
MARSSSNASRGRVPYAPGITKPSINPLRRYVFCRLKENDGPVRVSDLSHPNYTTAQVYDALGWLSRRSLPDGAVVYAEGKAMFEKYPSSRLPAPPELTELYPDVVENFYHKLFACQKQRWENIAVEPQPGAIKTITSVYRECPDTKADLRQRRGFHSQIIAARNACPDDQVAGFYSALLKVLWANEEDMLRGNRLTDYLDAVARGHSGVIIPCVLDPDGFAEFDAILPSIGIVKKNDASLTAPVPTGWGSNFTYAEGGSGRHVPRAGHG